MRLLDPERYKIQDIMKWGRYLIQEIIGSREILDQGDIWIKGNAESRR